MRPARHLAAVILLVTPQLATEAESAPSGPEPDATACVKHRTEARYRNLGYDHLVHLRNTCEARVVCRVSTNVNQEPSDVELRPGEERELLTWRGSPAREFTARVACQWARDRS